MAENKPLYTIGRRRIAIFGGTELWPILTPEGMEICFVSGARQDAEKLIDILNPAREILCSSCNGTGSGGQGVSCTDCLGTGRVPDVVKGGE